MRERDAASPLDPRQASAADAGHKAMIPVGRPFLDYVLSALADAGWTEACLVIGPEHGTIRDYYREASPPRRVLVRFAVQPEPRGTADAVLAAEAFSAGEEFLVLNSDNYYPAAVLRRMRALSEPGVALFEREALVRESNIPPERVRSYALCRVSPEGHLASIDEKPDEAAFRSAGADTLVSMNCWRFSPAIFRACRETPLSPRGELELPRAVAHGIATLGLRLRAVRCREGVLDLSRRSDIAAVAARLKGLEPRP